MNKMTDYRSQLDKVDQQLLETLAQRLEINREIRRYKADQQLPVVDASREQELLQNRKQYAEQIGVDPELTEELFKQILAFVTK